MFLFGKKGDEDKDPHKMTMTEIMDMVYEGVTDQDVKEAVGFEMTKAQYTKALNIIRATIKKDKRVTQVTKEALLGYKAGIIYGMALAMKLPPKRTDDVTEEFMKKKVCQMLFPFTVLDQGVDNWLDDNYLDNLLKNAKIADPKNKK